MDSYEHVLRQVLAEAVVSPDRLRSLLLDSPASSRRDQRSIVPAIVAAFEAGVPTIPDADWTAFQRRLVDRGDLTTDDVERALATWACVLGRSLPVTGSPMADKVVPTRRSVNLVGILAAGVSVTFILSFAGMVAGKLGNPADVAWLVVPAMGVAFGALATVKL